jgi:hypothetical protein
MPVIRSKFLNHAFQSSREYALMVVVILVSKAPYE